MRRGLAWPTLRPHLLVLPTPGKAQLLKHHLWALLLPALLLCPLSLPLVSHLPAESPHTASATPRDTAAHGNMQVARPGGSHGQRQA